MALNLVTAVLDRGPSDLADMAVLLALADGADRDTGETWPAQATIARRARQSERNVRRVVARLLAAGWLLSVERRTRASGASSSCLYRLNLAKLGEARADRMGADMVAGAYRTHGPVPTGHTVRGGRTHGPGRARTEGPPMNLKDEPRRVDAREVSSGLSSGGAAGTAAPMPDADRCGELAQVAEETNGTGDTLAPVPASSASGRSAGKLSGPELAALSPQQKNSLRREWPLALAGEVIRVSDPRWRSLRDALAGLDRGFSCVGAEGA